MNARISAIKKELPRVFCIVLTLVLFTGLVGCGSPAPAPADNPPASGDPASGTTDKPKVTEDDDDVIVAGTVDTSSNFSFNVEGAFVGMDEYSDEPEVILVCEFTNNSEKTISYGSALDAVAFQGGHELRSAYLRGAGAYTYENIEPGNSVPVLIGWKLVSVSDDVKITVVDRQHYAKEVLFEQSYTIDELIENSRKFVEEFGGIINEGQELSVST